MLREAGDRAGLSVFPGAEVSVNGCHLLAIWEPMEPLLEERDGRPRWEFPHYRPVDLPV